MGAIVTAEREVSPVGFDPMFAEYLADPYPFLAAAATTVTCLLIEAWTRWPSMTSCTIACYIMGPLTAFGYASAPITSMEPYSLS
jgi:hypothetical protein